MKRIILFLLLPVVFPLAVVNAQNGNTQVSYSNLALQYSSYNLNGDAGTGFFPSVASANGNGSYIDNPASIALIDESNFNFSLLNNRVSYENTFLNNQVDTDDNATKLGNIGFAYEIPTTQGSFVIGANYNRLTYQNGIERLSARNSQSTITDAFKDPSSDYYDLAFETYAIDYGDVDSTYLESIFRIGFTPEQYPGINQEAEISYLTDIGEYSFFLGTEFQRNLFLGVSGGVVSGTYTYRRDFLEIDANNDYDGDFIPSDVSEEGTDIDNILTHDEIDADIIGFDFRVGAIYKFNPNFNAGISYLLPSTLIVRESYYSSMETNLDDGSSPFFYDFASDEDFEYRIKKPGQLNIGAAINDLNNIDISFSVELIDHSNLELDFITGNDVDFNEEVLLREQQSALDSTMAADYNLVTNIKTSIGFDVTEQLKLKAGYAFLPAKSKAFEADRNVISAGVGLKITNNIVLDVNGQYSYWDDRSVMYTYFDPLTQRNSAEVISKQAVNLNIMAGLRFLF